MITREPLAFDIIVRMLPKDWYISDGPDVHRKELYKAPNGEWRLTTRERGRILTDMIFGVDIDSQAVEVTKLSLLLKVLEGESEQTLDPQLKLFHERALPDLGMNIKCGNSLVSDCFSSSELRGLSEVEKRKINAFDYEAEFPHIMKAGGFDAIVGNPPWGAAFTDPVLAYLRTTYSRVVSRMVDSYIYFFDRAIRLARLEAPVGFIIPSTILNQVDTAPLRRVILERGITDLISLGEGIFGRKVLNTSTILISQPVPKKGPFVCTNLARLPTFQRRLGLLTPEHESWRRWTEVVGRDRHVTFFVGQAEGAAVLDRLRQCHPPVEKILRGKIHRGVTPDIAPAHIVTRAEARALRIEPEVLRPSISASQIRRYHDWKSDQFLIYTTRESDIENCPHALSHLKGFKSKNTCPEVRGAKHPWWSLHRPRDASVFESPKIIGLTTARTIELMYDKSESLFVTDAMYVFALPSDRLPHATMAVMQSRLFLALYRISNQGESRVIPQVKATKLGSLPFPRVTVSDRRWKELEALALSAYEVTAELNGASTEHGRTVLQRRMREIENRMEGIVAELYELSEPEVATLLEVIDGVKAEPTG